MARLPQPGADSGEWGTILNTFLTVEHNEDGTLKSSGTLAAKADDAAVVHKTGSETVAGTKTFLAPPIVPTPTADGHAATKKHADDAATAAQTFAINRSNHTGTQATSTVTGLDTALSNKVAKGELMVNVKDFGALGNNTGNDADAINAAINSLPSSGTNPGGMVFIPVGTYRLTSPIILKSGVHLVGASRKGSRIVANAGGMFVWTAQLNNFMIEHLYLSGGGSAGHFFTPSGGDFGIHTGVVQDCTIIQQDPTKSIMHHVGATDYDNVTFRDCDLTLATGAQVPAFNIVNSGGAANQNRWTDCWANANNSNVAPFFLIESTSDVNYAYDNVFENITGERNAGGLIHALSTYNTIIRNCTDYDTSVAYTADVIKIGKSAATGGLPSVGALVEASGRRDNVTLPDGIYDINFVPSASARCTAINPNHSSSKLKVNWIDNGGHRIVGMFAGKGPAAQPTDATDFFQTAKLASLYIGNSTTGVIKKTVGTGSPEGVVTGSVGDEFTRIDGSGGNVKYVKRAGAATTAGWASIGRSLPPASTLPGGRRLLSGFPFPAVIASVALPKDTWRYSPLSLEKDLSLLNLSVLCSIVATGGTAALIFGLWSLDQYGRPATRQIDMSTYGSINLTVGAGGEATLATTGLVIPAGDWAIGCAWTGTATTNPTMYAPSGAHPGVASNSIATHTNAWSQAVSGATPPATAVVAAAAAQGIAIYGIMAS